MILEADGKVKYAAPGVGGGDLWAEKRRQERLEQLGFVVVRVSWEEVTRSPLLTVARRQRALSRGGAFRLA